MYIENTKIVFLKDINELVKSEGRITAFTPAAGAVNATIVLGDIPTVSGLSTSDDFGKYINFVDLNTGEIKGSAQIQSIVGPLITLKLTPTRTTVLGKTVSGDTPSDLAVDDQISGIRGSSVPYFRKPISNYIIQYAVVEIRRSLGRDVGTEESKLKQLEGDVEHSWTRRPSGLRVKRKSSTWTRNRTWR